MGMNWDRVAWEKKFEQAERNRNPPKVLKRYRKWRIMDCKYETYCCVCLEEIKKGAKMRYFFDHKIAAHPLCEVIL